MKQDHFLFGILIFIGVLVVAAIVLFLVRNHPPSYGSESTPAGVVYNYAVALQLKDYSRAYGYLADEPNRPSFDTFQQSFLNRLLDTSTTALQIGDVQQLANGDAWVNLTIQYAGSGVFNSGYSNTDKAILVQQSGAWKITSMPNPYWAYDWYQPVPAKTP